MKSSKLQHKYQRGIFIPLLAAIAMALVSMTFVLGYDVVRVKLASQELQRFADKVCYTTAKNTIIQKEALESFGREVNKLQRDDLKRSYLRKAYLTIPLMGEQYLGQSDPAQPIQPASSISIPSCVTTNPSESCQINYFPSGTMRSETVDGVTINFGFETGGPKKIPLVSGAGAVAGCEFAALPHSLMFSEPKPIVVKALYQSYVKGNYPIAKLTALSGSSSFVQSADIAYPGLTIGIVPYLPADPQDQRYRFRGQPTSGALDYNEYYKKDFLERYSPLHIFSPTFAKTVPGNSATKPAFGYQGSVFSTVPNQSTPPSDRNLGNDTFLQPETPLATPIDPLCDTTSGNCEDKGIYPPDASSPSQGPLQLSEMDDLLTSCLNPPTLIRNIFVSTVLELASRHGQLRGMTEVLVANPQNRNISDPLALSADSSPPVVVVPFRSDIADRKFELPYLFFNPEANATLLEPNSNLATLKKDSFNTPILPFTSQITNSTTSRYQSLFAGQLRNCYHLYAGASRLKRFNLSILNKNFLNNYQFEDGFHFFYSGVNRQIQATQSFAPSLALDGEIDLPWPSGGYTNSGGDWDQGDPSNMNPGRLTAAELVSVMGSAQLMPGKTKWESIDPINPSNSTYNIPPNQDSLDAVTYDLRGDVVGLLEYWLKKPARSANHSMTSLPFPGLLPSFFNTIPDDNFTTNRFSTLLLVLHRGFTVAEASAIRALIDSADFPDYAKPYIIIFYLPATYTDATAGRNSIIEAFNIPPPSYPNLEGKIPSVLIDASPNNTDAYAADSELGIRYSEAPYSSDPDLIHILFRRYWWDRLVGSQLPVSDAVAARYRTDNPVHWGVAAFRNYLLISGPKL